MMRIQNIYLREVFYNMRVSNKRLKMYVKYETDFFYPLFMYVIQELLRKYIKDMIDEEVADRNANDIEETDEKSIGSKIEKEIKQKIISDLYSSLEQKNVVNTDNKPATGVELKNNKSEIEYVYKEMWKSYDRKEYVTAFEKNLMNGYPINQSAKIIMNLLLDV